MRRLLLRSTKTPTFRSRVDVLFQNVKALKLRSHLDGLSVRIANPDERRLIEDEIGILESADTRFFVIEASGFVGYVVAGVMVFEEDDREYNEPSALLGEA